MLGPHLSIYVNSVHDLGCQLLSSSSLAVRLRPPPPILKACGSLTEGQHSPVSCDPEAVSQVFPSYLLPPSNDCLATTSRAAIPETTALTKVCLGSQREILLKCYLGFSFFFFLSLRPKFEFLTSVSESPSWEVKGNRGDCLLFHRGRRCSQQSFRNLHEVTQQVDKAGLLKAGPSASTAALPQHSVPFPGRWRVVL